MTAEQLETEIRKAIEAAHKAPEGSEREEIEDWIAAAGDALRRLGAM